MTPKDFAMNGREEKQDYMIGEEGKMATVFRRVPIDSSKEKYFTWLCRFNMHVF